MTLDEAIRFNEALRKDLKAKGMASYPEAIKLGIEALKLVQRHRSSDFCLEDTLLPGETREKE